MFTPTTDQVRAEWMSRVVGDMPRLRIRAEFDRWLNQVRAEALEEVWGPIHAERFAAKKDGFAGPDSFYAGILRAKNIVLAEAARYREEGR